MDLIEYQVLLPNEIQRMIQNGQAYVAVCTRR
ncbi:Uncharacterized protein BC05F1_03885 [Bacillus wiedmannii]|uniref:Uncharacterized protein n=1 Tax=Bacillus wiedmannii TaxID=1890302 RepID=A0A1C4ESX6_9BACI|nr:Uncharacterized protein BC05F1_03885 [Bacillus wiedmannii]